MDSTSPTFVEPLLVQLTIDGVVLDISPIKIAQLPKLIQIAEPMFTDLLGTDVEALSRFRAGEPSAVDLGGLVQLIGKHGQRVIEAIALCSRRPVEWVGELLPDRAAELLAVCLQVNSDFFSRAMPALAASVSRAGIAKQDARTVASSSSIGLTPSAN